MHLQLQRNNSNQKILERGKKPMKVILTKDISGLGSIASVVKVKGGYARNYLLPRSMAVVANPSNLKEIEHYKRILSNKKEKIIKEFVLQANSIKKVSLKIAKQVGEEDKIFGSVTAAEISELLEKEGIKISRKQIEVPKDIKVLGKYEASVQLHAEVSCNVKFQVIALTKEESS
jgi:large subunit ribosomal protein L9